MQINIKALELIYRNAETEEELDYALEHHGLSRQEFFDLAAARGWQANPIAAKNLSAQINELVVSPADPESVEASNKASIRRLNSIMEFLVTKFQYEVRNLSLTAAVDVLDALTKTRERLTKLELPLYGLSTSDPVLPGNPINIFMSDEGKGKK